MSPSTRPLHYSNPVIPGFHPDPSICRVGNDYFLVTSSFEYFPGLPLFHSRDLVDWQPVGHALTRHSQLNLERTASSKGLYAPTLRYHEGRFYLICTDVEGIGNFFVHTSDPAGEWSDPVRVPVDGIDPSLLFHEDRVWLTWSAPDQAGTALAELDIATGALHGELKIIWQGTGGKYPEGPHLYPHEGWFYLLISEGGTETGHMITVARSPHIAGPYEPCPHNPVLSHRSTDHPLQAVGHGDLVRLSSGEWWMVFLATRPHGYQPMHHLGRETCLAPVTWESGWPVVNGGQPLPRPDLPVPVSHSQPLSVHEGFDSDRLAHCWNFRRNPLPDAWSLQRRPGYLSLRCSASSLDDVAPLAFLGRRQQHFDCCAETTVTFDPAAEHEEAGITIQMNERYHASLVITRRGNQRVVLARRRMGTLRVEEASHELPPGPVGLRIVAEESCWHLEAGLAAGWKEIAMVETRHLSTELAGGFTGIYLGLFATGNGIDSRTWAEFDRFIYGPGRG